MAATLPSLNQVATVNQVPVSSYSMGASITTDGVAVDVANYVAIQFAWSGGSSPVGTCTVEGSCDGTNYSELPLSATLSVSGASGNNIADIQTGCTIVRAKYTRTSGSGNMTITFRGKG